MTQNNTLFAVGKWIVTLFTTLMVVTAALVGNGMFNRKEDWLLTGHMHLGNLLFVLAMVQGIFFFILYTRRSVGTGLMLVSALVAVFTFAQIGLGYSTRNNMADIAGWHIALGVGLTGTAAVLMTMLWMPTSRTNGGNTAG